MPRMSYFLADRDIDNDYIVGQQRLDTNEVDSLISTTSLRAASMQMMSSS
eukprot:CAMPEP_0170457074 /NCGR_PEP_ID=MMETSP0123-20130129/4488_1 /TAXON_ID=182087 /ORGANISM="Favella ehrenbergii, Strain Fehren 1" /LENGTH=49 /DNA_ID= /DNA_START= /DNA_END= /DNA_ORIENTATION=